MRRRLTTCIRRQGHTKVMEFCNALQKDPDALTELREMITINVSEFFRDAHQ